MGCNERMVACKTWNKKRWEKLEIVCFFFFFFKQKTAYEIVSRDWSSDVCSSDLGDFVNSSSVLSRMVYSKK